MIFIYMFLIIMLLAVGGLVVSIWKVFNLVDSNDQLKDMVTTIC